MGIYVIRHAHSMSNADGLVTGMADDVPLSGQGHVESVMLLERLAHEVAPSGPVHIISSPLLRAYQTAMPASQFYDAMIHLDYNLIERHTGRASGTPEKAVLSLDPSMRSLIACVEPEENIRYRAQRVRQRVESLDGDVLLFTHQIFSRYLIPILSQDAQTTTNLPNAGYVRIDPVPLTTTPSEVTL